MTRSETEFQPELPADECISCSATGTIKFIFVSTPSPGNMITIPAGGTAQFDWDFDVTIYCFSGSGTCQVCIDYSLYEKQTLGCPPIVGNRVIDSGTMQVDAPCGGNRTVHIDGGSVQLSWNDLSPNH